MPVSFSVISRLTMALIAPVPSSTMAFILRSGTGTTAPWAMHSLDRMERLHSGHLLIMPLPARMSMTVPVTDMSSPPPVAIISPTVFFDAADADTSPKVSSTLSTADLSPMFSWGMPFQERM